MTQSSGAETSASAPEHARDLQARLYREIGISAVAAALRFTTQPDPAPRSQIRAAEPAALKDKAA